MTQLIKEPKIASAKEFLREIEEGLDPRLALAQYLSFTAGGVRRSLEDVVNHLIDERLKKTSDE